MNILRTLTNCKARRYKINLILFFVILYFCFYSLYYLWPTFFRANEMLGYWHIPSLKPIGVDLKETVDWSRGVFVIGYTPMANIIFYAYTFFPHTTVFYIHSVFTILCTIALFFYLLPKVFNNWSNVYPLLFLLTVGSYGFHFELERGQWNIIAIFFVFAALFLFQRNKLLLSVAAFVFAVSLKIFPFIFIIFFTKDITNIRNTLRSYMLYGSAVFLSLFVLGYDKLSAHIDNLIKYMKAPYVWSGNHSIFSFVKQFNDQFFLLPLFQEVLFLTFLGMLAIGLAYTYLKKMPVINPYLILIAMIGAMIIPTVSHDYKLPILCIGAVALFSTCHLHKISLIDGALICFIIALTCNTMFSYVYYETTASGLVYLLLNNKFISLYGIAFFAVLLYVNKGMANVPLDDEMTLPEKNRLPRVT